MKERVRYQLKTKGIQVRPKPLPKPLEQRLAELPTAAAVVLGLVAIVGITSVSILAPNALQVLKPFLHKRTGRRPSQQEAEAKLMQTVYYLKKTGQIQLGGTKSSLWIKLGQRAAHRTEQLHIDSLVIPKPPQWDRSYWLVAADIPSKTHRLAADVFRRRLVRLGFYPLQRTLWLHPHNPKEQLQALLDYFNVGKFVTLLHVSELDNQDAVAAAAYWKEYKIL